ncbi:MAG TPA: hypothetical protein PLP61_16155 [Nocardioides sp.]|uniref:hypothetical protein n=1 Tax=Nocardioides sp. TaxID=35761 RepID=UPI002CCB9636|nr:hypothetical protein [Nocardioides sp.]HQR28578.1 hypothetical protein [Nocardioides sp.]
MGAPTVDALIDAWEQGLGASPTRRALVLLRAAHPGASADELAGLTLGERDVSLLKLRVTLFGDHIEALGSCPACDEELDVSFDVSRLLGSLPPAGTVVREMVMDSCAATVRPPTSADVLAVLGEGTLENAGARLLERCVTRTAGSTDGGAPAALLDRVAEEVVAADPAARIQLGLACAECGHTWSEVLDVAGFVWSEVAAWARRTLRDVHLLARAYGWREADILALTPRRRAAYLELVTG